MRMYVAELHSHLSKVHARVHLEMQLEHVPHSIGQRRLVGPTPSRHRVEPAAAHLAADLDHRPIVCSPGPSVSTQVYNTLSGHKLVGPLGSVRLRGTQSRALLQYVA